MIGICSFSVGLVCFVEVGVECVVVKVGKMGSVVWIFEDIELVDVVLFEGIVVDIIGVGDIFIVVFVYVVFSGLLFM